MLTRRVLVRGESVDSYTRADCCLMIRSALQAPPAHSHALHLRSSWRCRVCDARILRLMEDHVSGFGQVSLECVKRLRDCDEQRASFNMAATATSSMSKEPKEGFTN